MSEEDCFEIVETCLDHPNLEVLQVAEKIKRPDEGGEDEDGNPIVEKRGKAAAPKDKGISSTKLSICKGI